MMYECALGPPLLAVVVDGEHFSRPRLPTPGHGRSSSPFLPRTGTRPDGRSYKTYWYDQQQQQQLMLCADAPVPPGAGPSPKGPLFDT
jgi:hypothetical protein